MPDISMCANQTCSLAPKCYRYKAKPDPHWQTYGRFSPTINDQGEPECEYFWPLKTNPDDDKINKPFV